MADKDAALDAANRIGDVALTFGSVHDHGNGTATFTWDDNADREPDVPFSVPLDGTVDLHPSQWKVVA